MKDSVKKMLIAATVAGMFGFMPTDAEARINPAFDGEEASRRYENYQTFEQNELFSLDVDMQVAMQADYIINHPGIGQNDDAAGASILNSYKSAIANEILLYNLDDEQNPYVVTPGYYKLTFNPNEIGEGDGSVQLQLSSLNGDCFRVRYDNAAVNERVENATTFGYDEMLGDFVQRTQAEYVDSVSGVFARIDNAGDGGAIFNADETAHIGSVSGAQFLANRAVGIVYTNDGYDEYGNPINQQLVSATAYNGGAIANQNGAVIDSIVDSLFVGHFAKEGGAIYNSNASIGDISGNTFIYGNATAMGIKEISRVLMDDSIVTYRTPDYDNISGTYGGVISNTNGGNIGSIDNNTFIGYSAERGGAISNRDGSYIDTISNSTFLCAINRNLRNAETRVGGAIYNAGERTEIDRFSETETVIPESTIAYIDNVQFLANTASVKGGAIANEGTIDEINASVFNGSRAKEGGAIVNGGNIGVISGTDFIGNKAIYEPVSDADMAVENTTPESNIRDAEQASVLGIRAGMQIRGLDRSLACNAGAGGAISNAKGGTIGAVTNSRFIGNKATYKMSTLRSSSIRDTEMAAESMIRDNDDSSSGQNILSQANQNNQGVLSLLGVSSGLSISESMRNQIDRLAVSASSSRGGAIANEGMVGNITDSEFVKNAAEFGGAIYNSYNDQEIGALVNRLEHTINNITDAEMQSSAPAGSVLGALTQNTITIDCSGLSSSIGDISGTSFVSNNAYNGGAIYNGTPAQVLSNIEVNTNNTLSALGALTPATPLFTIINPEINVTVGNISDSQFVNNRAVNGGAIMNGTAAYDSTAMQGIWGLLGSATPVLGQANGLTQASETPELTINATIGDITRTLFENNRAQTGGAIFNQGGENARLNDMAYENVLSSSAPMSLLGRQVGGLDQADEMDGELEVAENPYIDFDFDYEYVQDFAAQDAKGYENGLDIDALFNTNVVANIGYIQNSTFRTNTADLYGGAIYNSNATIKGINNVLFEANQATAGGAIYNNGTITEGISDSQFIGNKAAMSELVSNSLMAMNTVNQQPLSVLGMRMQVNKYAIKMSQAEFNAGRGGAVYNEASLEIRDSRFEGNEAERLGGAIYNTGKAVLLDQAPLMEYTKGSSILGIRPADDEDMPIGVVDDYEDEVLPDVLRVIGTEFVNNSAYTGGAIFNDTLGTVELIEGCLFEGNTAVDGGAIAISGTINTINNTIFRNNTATGEARDISMADDEMVPYNNGQSLLGARVEEPAMVFGDGGAIRLQNGAAIMEMEQQQQLAEIMSGAPEMDEEAETVVRNVLTVNNSLFEGNSASNNGGAVYSQTLDMAPEMDEIVDDNPLSVLGRVADDDMAGEDSVVYEMTFVNTSFLNNKAGNLGGAIYADHNVNIVADGANVVIKDNIAENHGDAARSILDQSAESMLDQANQLNQGGLSLLGDGTPELDENDDLPVGVVDDEVEEPQAAEPEQNAIYIANADATLTLEAKNGGSVSLYDNVKGEQGYKVNIKGSDINLDRVNLYNDLVDADVTLDNVTLNTINNQTHTYAFDKLTLANNVNMVVDVDLANESMDRLTANSYELGENKINVAGMNLLSDAQSQSTKILFADNELKNNVTYGAGDLGKGVENSYQGTVYSPIYKYNVSYTAEDEGGFFNFVRGIDPNMNPASGSGSAPAPAPASYTEFNPAVLSSSVASQVSVAATQNIINNNAFHGVDMAVLRANERMAAKYANRYALGEEIIKTDLNTNNPLFIAPNQEEVWVKPYVTFENIPLRHGPKVKAINYGTMIGYDSNPHYMRHDWEGVWTGYIGYTGSQSKIIGVDTNSNGGLIGLTYSLFKGNFFNATTITAGAMLDQASTMYGKDDITTLYAGIGNKTGYNFQFKDGRFVLQPSLLLSYTFADTFNYKNAAGVRMHSEPLNTIQVSPGLKFYMNTKSGWQPYIGVNMMWNIMGRTDVKANNVALPRMSVKPYIQYGVGIQKIVKEHFTAYGEAMVQNGGRNGVSLTFGFKWAIGRNKK